MFFPSFSATAFPSFGLFCGLNFTSRTKHVEIWQNFKLTYIDIAEGKGKIFWRSAVSLESVSSSSSGFTDFKHGGNIPATHYQVSRQLPWMCNLKLWNDTVGAYFIMIKLIGVRSESLWRGKKIFQQSRQIKWSRRSLGKVHWRLLHFYFSMHNFIWLLQEF